MAFQKKFILVLVFLAPSVMGMRLFRFASKRNVREPLHRGSSMMQLHGGPAGGVPPRPLVDLIALVTSEGPTATVPRAIMDCVTKLENPEAKFEQDVSGVKSTVTFLQAEGLYRIPSTPDDINIFRRLYNKLGRQALNGTTNPHILANYIKQFLTDMTQPILGDIGEVLYALITTKSGDSAITETKKILDQLAKAKPIYECTLQFMLRHLYNVTLVKVNKMDASNLGMALAPSMMYREGPNVDFLTMTTRGKEVVGYLIANFPALYPDLPIGQLSIEEVP